MSFGHSRCFVCFLKAAPAQPKRESGGVRLLFLTRLPLARGEIVELQPILDLDNPPLLTVSTTLDLVKRYKSFTNFLDDTKELRITVREWLALSADRSQRRLSADGISPPLFISVALTIASLASPSHPHRTTYHHIASLIP
jgi:hypothetical protein